MFAPLGAEAAIEIQSSITSMGMGRLLNDLAERRVLMSRSSSADLRVNPAPELSSFEVIAHLSKRRDCCYPDHFW